MISIDTPTGWVRRLVAVIIAMTATTAALVGAPAPALAAACSSSSGVSVVLDYTGATGGVESACVPDGAGRPADEVISSAGFALTWVTRQPGFVCRVNGVPADDPCVNTPPPTAYWGVFWSDGEDGAWHYADVGVSGLQVPDGGYVGLAWQSGTRREPGQPATVHPETPTATPTATTAPTTTSPTTTSPTTTSPATTGSTTPTKTPTEKPTRKPGTPTSTPTPSPSPSTADPSDPPTPEQAPPSSSATESPSASATASGSASATESPSDSASASATAAPSESVTTESSAPSETSTPTSTEPRATEEESSRVPTWLTLTILGLLLVAIGMSTVAARRRTRN